MWSLWQQALVVALLLSLALIILLLIKRLLVRLYINFNGPFFAQTSDKRIEQIKQLAQLKPGMKIVDLGVGDGRVVIELVKSCPQIEAVGVELDPKYVKLARHNVAAAGLEKSIQIKHANFWDLDLSKYDVITTYCMRRFMDKLRKKLKKEVKNSCKIISVFFQFPNAESKQQLGDVRLYGKSGL